MRARSPKSVKLVRRIVASPAIGELEYGMLTGIENTYIEGTR